MNRVSGKRLDPRPKLPPKLLPRNVPTPLPSPGLVRPSRPHDRGNFPGVPALPRTVKR